VNKCFLNSKQFGFVVGFQDLIINLISHLDITQQLRFFSTGSACSFNPTTPKPLLEGLITKASLTETGRALVCARNYLEERSILVQTKQKGVWHLALGIGVGEAAPDTQTMI